MSRTQNLFSAEPVAEESLAVFLEDADVDEDEDAACTTMLLPCFRPPCPNPRVRLGIIERILLVPNFRCIPIVVRSAVDAKPSFQYFNNEHRRR